MSAMIIPFTRRLRNADRALKSKLCDALTQDIMREYAAYPVSIVKQAIAASNRVLDDGGFFMDAMSAAQTIILSTDQNHPIDHIDLQARRNFDRTRLFMRRRDRLVDTMMLYVEPAIRRRMQNFPEEDIHTAFQRARCVLEGGGHISRALHLAIPPDPGAA